MTEPVWIVGVSMLKFGRYPDKDTVDLGSKAAMSALDDAGMTIHDMGVLGVGCLYEANAMLGQRIQKQIGQTGIPVYNVANACATGATALRTVITTIKAGEADAGIAIGVEQMGKMGLLGGAARARKDEEAYERTGRYGAVMGTEGILGTNMMPGVFAQAGMEYAYKHDGVGFEQFAKVAEKNHWHSQHNPLAQYQKVFSLDEVMNAQMISYPNTLLMCCPTGDGAASAIIVSDEKFKTLSKDQQKRGVKIAASVLTSDPWSEDGQVQPDVNTLTRNAADKAYEVAGVSPQDLDLVELHDCFATAELCHYDNLSLCEPGGAGEFIDSGGPRRDGKIPVNVSGGLISKGHPLGATGLAQCAELSWQLRGQAGERQVEEPAVGLQHNIGLGGAAVVSVYKPAA